MKLFYSFHAAFGGFLMFGMWYGDFFILSPSRYMGSIFPLVSRRSHMKNTLRYSLHVLITSSFHSCFPLYFSSFSMPHYIFILLILCSWHPHVCIYHFHIELLHYLQGISPSHIFFEVWNFLNPVIVECCI